MAWQICYYPCRVETYLCFNILGVRCENETMREHKWLHSLQALKWYEDKETGSRLNIKSVFPRYGGSHVKDKTVGETFSSLTWESLYW